MVTTTADLFVKSPAVSESGSSQKTAVSTQDSNKSTGFSSVLDSSSAKADNNTASVGKNTVPIVSKATSGGSKKTVVSVNTTDSRETAGDKGKDESTTTTDKQGKLNIANVLDINVLATLLAQTETKNTAATGNLDQLTAAVLWKKTSNTAATTAAVIPAETGQTAAVPNKGQITDFPTSVLENKQTVVSAANQETVMQAPVTKQQQAAAGNSQQKTGSILTLQDLTALLKSMPEADSSKTAGQTATAATAANVLTKTSTVNALPVEQAMQNLPAADKNQVNGKDEKNSTPVTINVIDLTNNQAVRTDDSSLENHANQNSLTQGNLTGSSDDKTGKMTDATTNTAALNFALPVKDNIADTAAAQPKAAQQNQQAYDIAGQIVKNAQLIKANDNSQMVINLQPEHLGELSLKITVQADGVVNASFHSDNAQVRNIIQASVVQLRQDLQEQGIKVDNINVYSGLSDLMSNGQNGSGQFAQNNKKSAYRINQLTDAAGQMEDFDTITSVIGQNSSQESEGIDYKI
ncbi:flagellar hook-length control protein FliK [Pectinatus frisingensis]|uniref:flagellar hook-length control protein FliK n=1 Tax=Pectinatus frisingensis TaxID=865 RepID=UPI0018C72907|nr:flagellar hook-length control protein FliK [Pectinatus frisingensis]